MANKEIAISEGELKKIEQLLRSTPLTISEIARRTGTSRGIVASINRRLEIRKKNTSSRGVTE